MLRFVLGAGLGLRSSIIEKVWKSTYVIKFLANLADQRSGVVVRERWQHARGPRFDSRGEGYLGHVLLGMWRWHLRNPTPL